MPYTYEDYPDYLNTYPTKVRHQWITVFNNVFTKTKDEKRAFMAANAVLKKRVNKNKEELSESQYMQFLTDDFLGKLDG